MKPSKRELWKAVEEVGSTTGDIPDLTSDIVTVTEPDSEPVEVPADAELLETDSDVVTVWVTDA